MDLLGNYSDDSSGDEDESERLGELQSPNEEGLPRFPSPQGQGSRFDLAGNAAAAATAAGISRHGSSGISYNDDNDDDESDDDDDYGPRPAPTDGGTSDSRRNAGHTGGGGVPVPSTSSSSSSSSSSEAKDLQSASADNVRADNPAESVDLLAQRRKIPISREVHLAGHTKTVACISIEPAGNRLVTGSLDYCAKIYDFGGMDSRHRAFQSIVVEEGHPVTAVSHSPSGDRFVVATGSAQPRVYDRDGKEIIKFVKGDMYLRDMSHAKGHTMEVTTVQWHPSDKNTLLTSSLDGTLRIWNLLGEATFGMLISQHVLKVKPTATQRIGATACCYNPDGSRIYAGMSDGSILVFFHKKVFSRPDVTLSTRDSSAVRFLLVSPDNQMLAARYESGSVYLWSIQGNCPAKEAAHRLMDLPNLYPMANLAFSADSSLLIGCTSAMRRGEDWDKSKLVFFDLPPRLHTPPTLLLSLALASPDDASISGIAVKWHAATNHIYCSLSNGLVRVLFDPALSVKGALLSSGKAPKRVKDPSDFAVVGEIIAPLDVAQRRGDANLLNKGRKRSMELRDPVRAKIPEKPATSGPGMTTNGSFFFTQYVSSGKKQDPRHMEDPRAALLKYADEAKADPRFLGKAYQASQPQTILSDKTYEQEREDFKAKQRRTT